MRMKIAGAAMLLLLAAPADAGTNPPVSWGKAGVSFADYRADAIACARQAYYHDVADTDAARILIDASRKIDTITENGVPDSGNQQGDVRPSAGAAAGSTLDPSYDPAVERSLELAHRIGRTVQAARPDKQVADIAALQKSLLEQCLQRLGYHRFRLTREQQRQLDHLKRGSSARQQYLYGLAADPGVLRTQGA